MSKRTERDVSMVERIEQGIAKRAESKERRNESLRVPFPVFTSKEWDALEAAIETTVADGFAGVFCKSTQFTMNAWNIWHSTDEKNLEAVSDAFKHNRYYDWLLHYLDLMQKNRDAYLFMHEWMDVQIAQFLHELCTRWNKTHCEFVLTLVENHSYSIRVTWGSKIKH